MLLDNNVCLFLYGEKFRLIMFSDDITSGSWIWCFSPCLVPWCCSCWTGSALERHVSSCPLAQARIQRSQLTPCEGTCKYKGENSSWQLSALSLAPADIKADIKRKTVCVVWTLWTNLVFHSLSKWTNYWSIYCKECGLTYFAHILKEMSVIC